MTNNEPIRAQWGVAMALFYATQVQASHPLPTPRILEFAHWDGAKLTGLSDGAEMFWDEYGFYRLTQEAWQQVLPPLGNCSETPNSSIVAEVGMEVGGIVENDGGPFCPFSGGTWIEEIKGNAIFLKVATHRGALGDWKFEIMLEPLEHLGDGWYEYEDTDDGTKTKVLFRDVMDRPVVLPNCKGLLNSCPESEPSLPDSASDHIPDAGKMVEEEPFDYKAKYERLCAERDRLREALESILAEANYAKVTNAAGRRLYCGHLPEGVDLLDAICNAVKAMGAA